MSQPVQQLQEGAEGDVKRWATQAQSTLTSEEGLDQQQEYMIRLMALERVRKRMVESSIDAKLQLPQICAVGDQSSGKSALMEAISGIPFPQSTGTCTKCPIVVRMQPGKDKSVFCIDDGKKLSIEEVSDAIKVRQEELVAKSASGPSGFSSEAMNIMATTNHPHRLVCVDLPGIIHNNLGDEEQGSNSAWGELRGFDLEGLGEFEEAVSSVDKVAIVQDLIKSNIDPVETLIVVVTASSQDDELAKAVKLAHAADKTGDRTLRVYTKCDVKESKEQRVKLIKKVKAAAADFRKGKKLASHFVAVRDTEGKLSAKEERASLKGSLGLEENDMCVVGQESLASRLEHLLSQRISENLPSLRAQITSHRKSAQEELRAIRSHPVTYSGVLSRLENELETRLPKLDNELTKLMTAFRKTIHKTKKEAENEKKSRSAFSSTFSVFSSPFFQGEKAFKKRVKDICDVWKPLAVDFGSKVATAVDRATDLSQESSTVFEHEFGALHSSFRERIHKENNKFSRDVRSKLMKKLDDEMKKEMDFGTVNHYLTSKFETDMKVPPQEVKSVLEGLKKDDFKGLALTHEINHPGSVFIDIHNAKIVDVVVDAISKRLEARCVSYAAKSLEDQQQERVAKAVTAYWAVMHKNFLDNVLKAVRDVVKKGMEGWIKPGGLRYELRCHEGHELEDGRVAERRKTLGRQVEVMNECEQDLENL